jgi:hypothetical protein
VCVCVCVCVCACVCVCVCAVIVAPKRGDKKSEVRERKEGSEADIIKVLCKSIRKKYMMQE